MENIGHTFVDDRTINNNNKDLTPLLTVAKAGNLKILEFLLKEPGVNTEVTSKDGLTIHELAYLSRNIEVVKYLFKNYPYAKALEKKEELIRLGKVYENKINKSMSLQNKPKIAKPKPEQKSKSAGNSSNVSPSPSRALNSNSTSNSSLENLSEASVQPPKKPKNEKGSSPRGKKRKENNNSLKNLLNDLNNIEKVINEIEEKTKSSGKQLGG